MSNCEKKSPRDKFVKEMKGMISRVLVYVCVIIYGFYFLKRIAK